MKYLNKKSVLICLAAIIAGILIFFIQNNHDIDISPLQLDGKTSIQFPYTDENSGESLIIKTNQQTYSGLADSDAYISITNTTDVDEKAVLLFYFPKADVKNKKEINPGIKTLAQYQESDKTWNFVKFFKDNIKLNDNLLSNALKKRETIPKELAINSGTQIEIPANKTIYFKSKIQYPPGSKGEFWIETIGANGGYGLLDPWYTSTFSYRKKITIPYTKVSGGSNLTNFPVLISHTDPDLRTTANGGKAASGSGEFIFTSSDGTTSLPYEIESYSATTGQFIGWVNVTTLSAIADTYLYMYYGGAAAGGATNQNKTGTWNSAYVGVYHMNDNLASTVVRESTSNAYSGTNQANTNGKSVTGQVGNGLTYNSSTDYTTVSDQASFTPGAGGFTVSAWLKPASIPAATNGNRMWAICKCDNPFEWNFTINDNSTAFGKWNFGAFTSDGGAGIAVRPTTTSAVQSSWQYVVATLANAAATPDIFFNGLPDNGTANVSGAPGVTNTTSAVSFGRKAAGGEVLFDGVEDEIRVSSAVRTNGWIATEYNNQNSPRTFYALGGQEVSLRTPAGVNFGTTVSSDTKPGWYTSTFSYRKKITIPYTKVSGGSNLSNFPVLISHTDADLRTTANGGKAASGSGEFIFTSSDGTTSLPYEIESYSATTGQFIGWVNVTTLSASADTYLYMYYGGAAAGGATNQNKTGTWNANYQGVYHLGDGDSTAASFYKDSTSNARAGTLTDADADTAQMIGKVGNAMDFNGDADSISLGNNIFGNLGDSVTVSAWFKTDNLATFHVVISEYQSGVCGDFYFGKVNAVNNLTAQDGGAQTIIGSTAMGTNIWFYGTFVSDTTLGYLYVNGLLDKTHTADLDWRNLCTGQAVLIGSNTGASYWDGGLDEVRVSNTDRSAGWIATEYNNQNSPRTFYALGGQEVALRTAAGVNFGTTVSTDTKPGWYTSTFSYRKKITIPYTKVSGGSNLSNFPVLISHTDPDLRTTANGGKAASGSGEFIFTSSDGTTSLPYEIETYSATTGQFIGWVNVTTLSATADTYLYMYYGGAAAGGATNQNKTGTWNSNYRGVWHLNETVADEGSGTDNHIDSTSNANHGDQNGNDDIGGKMGNGQNFDGTNDYINVADSTSLSITGELTISLWSNPDTAPGGLVMVDKNDAEFRFSNFESRPRLNRASQTLVANTAQTTGVWQYLAVTAGSGTSTWIHYRDGKFNISSSKTVTPTDTTNTVAIGANSGGGAIWFDGRIDEVRISTVILTPGWIATEYANQNSPRTFYVLGGQEGRTSTNPGLQFK